MSKSSSGVHDVLDNKRAGLSGRKAGREIWGCDVTLCDVGVALGVAISTRWVRTWRVRGTLGFVSESRDGVTWGVVYVNGVE